MGNTLTKDEIVKAWECCGKNEREKTGKYCDECPAHNKPYSEGIHGCLDYLTQCSTKCLKESNETDWVFLILLGFYKGGNNNE